MKIRRNDKLPDVEASTSDEEEPEIYALKREGSNWKLSRRDWLSALAAGAVLGGVAGLTGSCDRDDEEEQVYKAANVYGQPSLAHEGFVHALAITPDGKMLVSGGSDRSITLWSLSGQSLVKVIEAHSGEINVLAIDPGGRLLVSGGSDRSIRLWSLPDVALLRSIEGHKSGVNSLAISPDGRLLASGSSDATVKLWSLPQGDLQKILRDGNRSPVKSLAISPDSSLLASGTNDATINLWSLPDGHLLKTMKEGSENVSALAISSDGRMIASGSKAGIGLWSLPDGEPLKTLASQNGGEITALCMSSDRILLSAGGINSNIQLWSLSEGARGYQAMV